MTAKEILYGNAGYTGIEPAERSAWESVLERFRSLSARFDAAVADLRRVRNEVAVTGSRSLIDEHAALEQRARRMVMTVEGVRRAVADVRNALAGAVDAITGSWDQVREWVGLGLPPLIPIAVVAASVAALTSFLADYAKFARRLAEYRRLIGSGASPSEASQIVERLDGSGWLGSLPIGLVIGGAVLLMLLWKR